MTCGGGLSNPIKTADRGPCGPACNLPAPRACNEQCCKGKRTFCLGSQNMIDNRIIVPVDCVQDQWSMWSNCSASCGVDGVSIRKRIIEKEMECDGIPCGVNEEVCSICVCTVGLLMMIQTIFITLPFSRNHATGFALIVE